MKTLFPVAEGLGLMCTLALAFHFLAINMFIFAGAGVGLALVFLVDGALKAWGILQKGDLNGLEYILRR